MLVDSHMHLFATAEEGRRVVGGYPVIEYGERDEWAGGNPVAPNLGGTVEDGIAALDAAGAEYGFLLSSWEPAGGPFPPGGERHWPADPPHPGEAEALRADNAWLCDAAAREPRLLAFVNVHPGVLGAEEAAAHVADLAARGARGVKLHTVSMRTYPDDPAMAPALATCAGLGLPVVAHCGPDRHGAGWSLPGAFGPVLESQPDLQLVLAHLGGAAWEQTAAFAAAYPRCLFDLSEIVSWTGAERAPTAHELVALIRAVGTERVLMGSDFPWYTTADVAAAVGSLPGLTPSEREAILGGNAARLLGLG